MPEQNERGEEHYHPHLRYLEGAVDEAVGLGTEIQAERREKFTAELVHVLGEPSLVTDPADGITRPTWTLEVPYDRLSAICEKSNRRMPQPIRILDDSEGGETD